MTVATVLPYLFPVIPTFYLVMAVTPWVRSKLTGSPVPPVRMEWGQD